MKDQEPVHDVLAGAIGRESGVLNPGVLQGNHKGWFIGHSLLSTIKFPAALLSL